MKLIKPPALRPGDKVGIIAPASSFNHQGFAAGCERLRQMGHEPVFAADIFDRDIYFAGPTERRLQELETMLQRSDIAALICARGGYGSNHLLERLNFELFARHPKIIVGCSDITTLLTAITDRTGLVTFHGPMVAKDIASVDGMELTSWNHALLGAEAWEIPAHNTQVLRPGQAEGRLYGGCLSLIAASLGTDFEAQTDGAILFLEDIAEKPYRIDRMLMQLRLAGKLDHVRAIVFGEMTDCVPPGSPDYTLQEVILRVLHDFQGPIVYGLSSGHVKDHNITLPLGVHAELIAESTGVKLRITEAATECTS
jgi:muramoyltetrapeptide carboxypeptidase